MHQDTCSLAMVGRITDTEPTRRVNHKTTGAEKAPPCAEMVKLQTDLENRDKGGSIGTGWHDLEPEGAGWDGQCDGGSE